VDCAQSNFTLQGTTIELSAHVFARNNVVHDVYFTATLPGQPPVVICEGKVVMVLIIPANGMQDCKGIICAMAR